MPDSDSGTATPSSEPLDRHFRAGAEPVADPAAADAAGSEPPAPPPPSPRASFARDALIAAVLLGLVADPLLRNGLDGVGLVIWMLQLAVAVVVLTRQNGHALSREAGVWLAVAVFFSGGLAWRDAGLLQFFDVLAMLGALTLLAMSMNGIPVSSLGIARVRDLIRGAFGTGISVVSGAPGLLLRDAELHGERRSSGEWSIGRITRAVAIAAPIFLVFALLLIDADPLFGSLVTLPDVDFDVVASHFLIAGFFAWVVAGWLRRSFLARPDSTTTLNAPLPLTFGAAETSITLGTLAVLFAAFVIVQMGWLFGGEALVLRTTGLGYAQYARRGFFELVWVAVLLLPVLLGTHALIPADDARTLRLYRRLALPLVGLLGAILVSAGARMRMYIHYYGISTDRLYAITFMIWLAVVFAWLAFTVLRARPRTFALGMAASAYAVLFVLNVSNPDALVARANLARASAVRVETSPAGATPTPRVAGADPEYIAYLGGDAIPLLVSALTSSDAAIAGAPLKERCAAARILLERWSGPGGSRRMGSWTRWNLARSRALHAVQAHDAELTRLACPDKTAK